MRNRNIAKAFAFILVIALIYLIGYGIYRDKLNSKRATEAIQAQKLTKEDSKEDTEVDTEVINDNTLKYKDKNWMAIGDEITKNNQYQKYVVEACEFDSVLTTAQSGIPLHLMDDKVTAELLKDIDVVTIFAGINDFSLDRQLGTIDDSTLMDTFYSDMKAVIENLQKIKPKMEIVFITTPYVGRDGFGFTKNNVGNTLVDYTKAMNEVCDSYDIPILDLQANSGINENNLVEYSDDSAHPNEAGMELIGKQIGEFMNKL